MTRKIFAALAAILVGCGLLAVAIVSVRASGRTAELRALAGVSTPFTGTLPTHVAYLPFITSNRPPYELRINVGGPAYAATGGLVYQADRAYSPASGSGYVYSGTVVEWYNADSHPMGGTTDKWLYADARADFGEYRVDLPNDAYLVTLQMASIYQHAPGQLVFDVSVESTPVLTDFDLYAEANLWYAVDIPVPVVVTDAQLNVVLSPTVGLPLLNAIAVTDRNGPPVTPTAPSDVQALGCYARNLVDWAVNSEPDLLGYRVGRADGLSGTLQTFTSALRYVPYYLDDAVEVGRRYTYTVQALNAFGQASGPGQVVTASALPPSSTALPVYELEIAPEDLAMLNADPWADEYVPAVFRYDGQSYDVDVRYRGGRTTRNAPKKSWRVRFPENQLFEGQRILNLNAEFNDRTLVKEKLAYDLFQLFGVNSSDAGLVHLRLNGQFWGVYTQVEHVDEYFLQRTGRALGSTIYEVNVGGDYSIFQDPQRYEIVYSKRTNESSGYDDLIAFIELINNTSDEEFPTTILKVFDVVSYLHYYATVILTGNIDVMEYFHNSFLIHDPVADRWEVLPWDNGAAFLDVDLPIDHGTPRHVLLTRILDVPEFRLYYGRFLIEAMDDGYSPASIDAMTAGYRDAVGRDGECDTWHRYWWSREFDPDLSDFVEQRNAYLQSVVYSYTEGLTLPLTLSVDGDRLMLRNDGLLDWDVGGMTVKVDSGAREEWVLPANTRVPAGGAIVLWNAPTAHPFALSTASRVQLLDRSAHENQLVTQWVNTKQDGE